MPLQAGDQVAVYGTDGEGSVLATDAVVQTVDLPKASTFGAASDVSVVTLVVPAAAAAKIAAASGAGKIALARVARRGGGLMPLLAVAGVKGAPGATTFAVALAGVLPGPALLADLDLAGSDLSLRYRDPAGQPLDPDRGLLSLAAAAHRGAADPGPHVQHLAGGLPVLLGLTAPEQAGGLATAWPHVEAGLAAAPGTVVADCGRLTAPAAAPPVLRSADAVLLVARTDVASLAHLRERVRAVAEARGVRRPAAGRPASEAAGAVGVVLVAPQRERGVDAEVQRLLDAAGLPGRVLGAVADDPKGALVLAGAARGAPGRTDLVRSVRGVAPAVVAFLADAARLTAGAA